MRTFRKLRLAALVALALAARAEAQSVVFRAEALDGTAGWYSVPLAGGKVTPIAVGSFGAHGAAWAPDGKTVILKEDFQDPVTGACCDRLTAYGAPAGTPVVYLTVASIPWRMSVSPDSRTVVFVGDYLELYAVPITGGPVTQLTASDSNWLESPAHSPDGAWIAYYREYTDPGTGVTEGQVVRIPAAGGPESVVVGGAEVSSHPPGWSPDGRTIAYLTATGDVALVDVATGSTVALTAGRQCIAPSFSPDGTMVVAVCGRDGGAQGDLLVFPASGGAPSVLAVDALSSGRGPSWVPDSQRVAYITASSPGWPHYAGITVVDSAGVPTEIVPQGPENAQISTVMVQPSVPTPAVSIASARLDYVAARIAVEATSARGARDTVTLLGYGPMTWSQARRRWIATAPAPEPWESVGVCGLDGCAFLP